MEQTKPRIIIPKTLAGFITLFILVLIVKFKILTTFEIFGYRAVFQWFHTGPLGGVPLFSILFFIIAIGLGIFCLNKGTLSKFNIFKRIWLSFFALSAIFLFLIFFSKYFYLVFPFLPFVLLESVVVATISGCIYLMVYLIIEFFLKVILKKN